MAKRRKDSYFGVHLDLHPCDEDFNLGADVDEENIRNFLLSACPDFATYDCKGHPGYAGYQTNVGYTAPGICKDSLAVWRKVTKELGIGLGVHYSGLQDFIAIEKHPEYARLDACGKPDGKTVSVFSAYLKEYLIPQLDEIINRYDVDAVWLDAECWGAEPDYSPAALDAWHKYSGGDTKPVEGDPDWQEFKNFHRRAFEDYLKSWTSMLHALHPNVDCCSNWAYTTMMPKPVEAEIDMISGDFDPVLACDRARTECRYLENTGRDWELQSWSFDLIDGQDECRKTPAQLMQEASVVLMHGGGYMNYYLPSRGGHISQGDADTARKVSAFVREREGVCHRSKPVREVAVFYNTYDQLTKSDRIYTWWGNRLDRIEGTLHGLLENHYSATVIAEHNLGLLNEASLLVVPEFDVIKKKAREAIEKYVSDGGSALFLGANACFEFRSMLGIKSGKREERHTSIFTKERVSANGVWLTPDDCGEVLFYRYEGDGPLARSSYMDFRAEGVSPVTAAHMRKLPAAVSSRYGKGRCAGVLCDLGDLYFHNHHPNLREAFRIAAENIFEPLVRTDAPAEVDLSLRRLADGKFALHLCDLAGMPLDTTRRFPERIPPQRGIRICVRAPRPKSLRLEPSGVKIPFVYENDEISFVLPEFQYHCAVVFED